MQSDTGAKIGMKSDWNFLSAAYQVNHEMRQPLPDLSPAEAENKKCEFFA